MRMKDLFEKWGLTGLKVKTPILEMDWEPSDPDKSAAWDLYVELLTRITTQPLDDAHGDEKTALDSVYSLFAETRAVLKANGPGCMHRPQVARGRLLFGSRGHGGPSPGSRASC